MRHHPWLSGILAFVVTLLLLAHVVGFAVAEPLRKAAERRVNEVLVGYSVRIGGLSLNVFGLGVDLLDVAIVQTSHPEPPIAALERFGASIQWGALLSGDVVGDLVVDSPRILLDSTQARAEVDDKKDLQDRGWQEAVERIYPLKINAFQVRDGEITYDDGSDFAPIHATGIRFLAQDIRNVSSREGAYPSPVRLDAVVFDSGRVRFDGAADFLAKPHAAVHGDVAVTAMPLSPLTPIARRYAVQLTGGTLSADGSVEVAAKMRKVDLSNITLDGIKADFVKEGRAGERGERVAKQAVRGATDPKAAPETVVHVDHFSLTNGELGFVDRESDPVYRMFVSKLDVQVRDFTNEKKNRTPGTAEIKGSPMGSGSVRLTASFQPTDARAEFESNLEIKDVEMVTMNDVLRARGGFDVNAGRFSLYSELAVRDGRVDGYVKPIFSDLDVYDRRQDGDKNILRQAYEGIVGGIGSLLENRPRDEVATITDLSGRIESPATSTWEIVVGLVQNAFVRAILPGLEQEADSG